MVPVSDMALRVHAQAFSERFKLDGGSSRCEGNRVPPTFTYWHFAVPRQEQASISEDHLVDMTGFRLGTFSSVQESREELLRST